MTTDFVLNALQQAVHALRPGDDVVHHSNQRSQYLSIRYSERLEDAGIKPSVGSVADSYDNALAETIIGLYKTELLFTRRAVEERGCLGVHNSRLGGLVQPSSPNLADRLGPAR